MSELKDSKWLAPSESPSLNYYFKIYSGERGEANSPLGLFDLLINADYSDCDDRKTQLIMLGMFAKDVAAMHLAAQGIRATVFDGLGPVYDSMVPRYLDEIAEAYAIEFENAEDPVILDFWDEWTLLASLIKCGYLKLYEKVETFGLTHQEHNCKTCYYFEKDNGGCTAWDAADVAGRMEITCPFWSRNKKSSYADVTPVEPLWKKNFVPIENRTSPYKNFRHGPLQ